MLGRQNLEVNMHGALDGSPIWRRNQHLQPKVPDAAEMMHILQSAWLQYLRDPFNFFFSQPTSLHYNWLAQAIYGLRFISLLQTCMIIRFQKSCSQNLTLLLIYKDLAPI